MVSKNQIKLITSLQQKKYRAIHGLFVAEGVKVIQELLQANFELHSLYQTESLFESVPNELKSLISSAELSKISALTTANNCLALFKIPATVPLKEQGLIVALDDIRDPGNLGTILRLCDWFGVTQLVCSKETVDLYNPKVVQATMGSISRVKVSYVDLLEWIVCAKLPVYGALMDGENIYKGDFPKEAIIVLGNEANGINKELEKSIKNRITIPRFGKLQQTESLNVATATAIILSEFCRNQAL
ncbi:MAG: RNA methyltransferase [Flavobacterium sp.]|nr:RNA methyltransferase [Flavobacterium sp.]